MMGHFALKQYKINLAVPTGLLARIHLVLAMEKALEARGIAWWQSA